MIVSHELPMQPGPDEQSRRRADILQHLSDMHPGAFPGIINILKVAHHDDAAVESHMLDAMQVVQDTNERTGEPNRYDQLAEYLITEFLNHPEHFDQADAD